MQEKKPSSFVLWVSGISEQSRLRDPAALFTMAEPEHLKAFVERCQPWLYGIPGFVFSTTNGYPFAEPPQHEEHQNIPWRVRVFDCADGLRFQELEHAIGELSFLRVAPGTPSGDETAARMYACTNVAAELAAKIKGPAWEVYAEQSGGLLVAGIVRAQRHAVALSDAPADAVPTASMAITSEGASLTSRELDVEGDFHLKGADKPKLVLPRGLIH